MLVNTLLNLILLMSLDGNPSKIKIPKKWTPEFTISVEYSGGMDGSYSMVTFTYDSLEYKRTSYRTSESEVTSKCKLTEADRNEILNKLRSLKIDKVNRANTNLAPKVVHDGFSLTLCIGLVCVSGGPSSGLADEDRSIVSSTSTYLEDFAASKENK